MEPVKHGIGRISRTKCQPLLRNEFQGTLATAVGSAADQGIKSLSSVVNTGYEDRGR